MTLLPPLQESQGDVHQSTNWPSNNSASWVNQPKRGLRLSGHGRVPEAPRNPRGMASHPLSTPFVIGKTCWKATCYSRPSSLSVRVSSL